MINPSSVAVALPAMHRVDRDVSHRYAHCTLVMLFNSIEELALVRSILNGVSA